MTPPGQRRQTGSLAAKIAVAFFSRLVLNTAKRFVYPFAPDIGRHMGVSLSAVTAMIAVNQLAGILSLLFGPMGDRWGYRRMMMAGLSVLALGMAIGGALTGYLAVMAALFLAGLAKSIFDPAILAHTGREVSFARRGMAIGILEVSWAGSTLIGIPLIGILIARVGWRAPFWMLAVLALLCMALVARVVKQRGAARTAHLHAAPRFVNILAILKKPAPLGTACLVFSSSMANEILFVVYGAWMERDFGMGVAALGFSTMAIGVAELAGEFLVAGLSDRLGIKRSVAIGLGVSGLCYLTLPLFSHHVAGALMGIFGIFLTYEFAIVCCLSLATELVPAGRGAMLSAFIAASALGRCCGAVAGPILWRAHNLWGVSLASGALIGLALVVMWGALRCWQPEPPGDPSSSATE